MPSRSALKLYYETQYWQVFRGSAFPPLLQKRDLEHFQQLDDLGAMVPGATLINFGSGHGGLSYLAHARGLQVVNVDLFSSSPFGQIQTRPNLPRDQSADVVYASHSLEHVTNIDDCMTSVYETLRPGGLFYIEVPDLSRFEESGAPPFREPHTYYFTRSFFQLISGSFAAQRIDHRKQLNPFEQERYSESVGSGAGTVLQVVLQRLASPV
jgi:2-polyprenyl-3-methyl-5-hydroxy-6-metoxy-1,4-benzoquinol methylase